MDTRKMGMALLLLGACAEVGDPAELPVVDEDPPPLNVDVPVDPPVEAVKVPCDSGDLQVEGPEERCYFAILTPLTFADAEAQCGLEGAGLAMIGDADEQALVFGLIAGTSTVPDFYLGATDNAVEGTFVWLDNSALAYNHFRAGEPNNGNGNEDCVILESDTATGTWDDRRCGALYPFVCERAALYVEAE